MNRVSGSKLRPFDRNRRKFLTLGAALAATSVWPRVSRAAEPDVVVIGAGAAGMAAAC